MGRKKKKENPHITHDGALWDWSWESFYHHGVFKAPKYTLLWLPTGALGLGECSEERGKLGSGRSFISQKRHEKGRFGCFERICVIRCVSRCFIHWAALTLWTTSLGLPVPIKEGDTNTCPGNIDESILRPLKETCYIYPWYSLSFLFSFSFLNVVLRVHAT